VRSRVGSLVTYTVNGICEPKYIPFSGINIALNFCNKSQIVRGFQKESLGLNLSLETSHYIYLKLIHGNCKVLNFATQKKSFFGQTIYLTSLQKSDGHAEVSLRRRKKKGYDHIHIIRILSLWLVMT
jgi:hypothetical protein